MFAILHKGQREKHSMDLLLKHRKQRRTKGIYQDFNGKYIIDKKSL